MKHTQPAINILLNFTTTNIDFSKYRFHLPKQESYKINYNQSSHVSNHSSVTTQQPAWNTKEFGAQNNKNIVLL